MKLIIALLISLNLIQWSTFQVTNEIFKMKLNRITEYWLDECTTSSLRHVGIWLVSPYPYPNGHLIFKFFSSFLSTTSFLQQIRTGKKLWALWWVWKKVIALGQLKECHCLCFPATVSHWPSLSLKTLKDYQTLHFHVPSTVHTSWLSWYLQYYQVSLHIYGFAPHETLRSNMQISFQKNVQGMRNKMHNCQSFKSQVYINVTTIVSALSVRIIDLFIEEQCP